MAPNVGETSAYAFFEAIVEVHPVRQWEETVSKLLFLSVIALSAVAFADDKEHIRQARRYGAEAKIIVSVVHEDGSSVAGAEITGTFPKVDTRNPKYYRHVNVQTDIDGQATLQASCGGDVFISVKKAGYYPSREVVFFNTGEPSCVKDGRWHPW